MILRTTLALVCFAVSTGVASAQTVVPSERVTSRVVVRDAPGRHGADVGSLRPGASARLVEAGESWHQIQLEDGTTGFASSAWTVLLPAGWDVSARPPTGVSDEHADRFDFAPEATLEVARTTEAAEAPGGVSGFFRRVASFFRAPEIVSIDLASPAVGEATRQHYDPRLPVAGRAHTTGSSGRFDVMVVIDVSASTGEFALADVDGDGREHDDWRTSDSILHAQTRAAGEFIRAVERLPGNRDGRRIRVGVVAFAGDDALLLHPPDRELDLDEADLEALAARDATLESELSRDYAATLAALDALAARGGSGMTDYAAGLTRATLALASPPEDEALPDERADRVIYFLTDGKPRLPYDREKADRAARKAAAFAARNGVRVHTFALGKDVVTGKLDPTVQRIARTTGGTFTELENPADIIPLLRATALSFVDRVKLVNRTSGRATDYVTTGIDGSFYGEIPLEEGRNEIELVAVLYGGKEHVETFRVDFEPVPREQRMAEELDEIRRENAALIEDIKEKLRGQLAAEMERERERERQDKELELAVPSRPSPGS